MRLFSLRQEFSKDWYRFLTGAGVPITQSMVLELGKERFPFPFQEKQLQFVSMEVYVDVEPAFSSSIDQTSLKLTLDAGSGPAASPIPLTVKSRLLHGVKPVSGNPGQWQLTMWLDSPGGQRAPVPRDAIRDIVLVCRYALA